MLPRAWVGVRHPDSQSWCEPAKVRKRAYPRGRSPAGPRADPCRAEGRRARAGQRRAANGTATLHAHDPLPSREQSWHSKLAADLTRDEIEKLQQAKAKFYAATGLKELTYKDPNPKTKT